MNLRPIAGITGAIALVAALPLPSHADAVGHTPPKLLKMGSPSSSIEGAGVVVVQVLVNPDGTFHVQRIIRSSNVKDNAVAAEIANSSTYKPATRGGKPILEFYDFTLRFANNGVKSDDAATGTAQYERMLHAGNAQGARDGLAAYVDAHPTDSNALLLLGTAESTLGHFPASVAAFQKAGPIPETFRTVAANSYSQLSSSQAQAKDYTGAIASAKQAIAIAPTATSYNLLGFAELGAGDFTSSVRDLEQARTLAAVPGSKMSAAQRATIDGNLVAAYLGAGDMVKAKAVADEVHSLDPSSDAAQYALSSIYAKQAEAKMKGQPADAAALYEQAGDAAPKNAVTYYSNAAFAHLNVRPVPESDKALADAKKALAVDPANAGANFAAGIALANKDQKADGLTYLHKAEDAAKNNPDLLAQIERNIAQINGIVVQTPPPAPTPQPVQQR
jgi:tetratricopeptide (TPR) repeat protein